MTALPYSLPTFPTWHAATHTASAGRRSGTDTGHPGRTVRTGHMAGSHGAGTACTDCISPHPKGFQGGDAHAGPLMAPGNAGWSMPEHRPRCGAVWTHQRRGARAFRSVLRHGLLVSPVVFPDVLPSFIPVIRPRATGDAEQRRQHIRAHGPNGHITPRDSVAKLGAHHLTRRP